MDNRTLYGDTSSVTYEEIANLLDQAITPSFIGSGFVPSIKSQIKLYEDGIITLRDLVVTIHEATDTLIMDVIGAKFVRF